MPDQAITFGPFALDTARGLLLRDGKAVSVGQRGLALLQVLVEAEGRVVAKADLLERAWPGSFVEEGNLTVQIAALRKALGETPDGQPWIVTVPRVGYRLPQARAAPQGAAVLPEQPTIVVLPFQNLGGDPEQAYFADGVVNEIITALSRFRSFAVIARNAAFVYKDRAVDAVQVARELGVAYVLEGSVRRAGDRLRITAQLIEGATGAQLWAEQFDGALADVFDVQDKITERVAMEVEPHIHLAEIARSRLQRPGSIATYDIYLQALAKILNKTTRDNAEAYALLTAGLALEPDNALLLSHVAWVLDHRSAMGWPPIGPDDMRQLRETGHRGLQHAAGNPTVMAQCGLALLQGAKEYDLGMAVLRSAAEANPNSLTVATASGIAHLHCGSIEDSLTWFHRALRLSPRDPFAYDALAGIAHAQLVLGNYPEALVWATRALALNPTFDPALWMLIAANAHLGRIDEARRFVQTLRTIAPSVTIASIRAGQPAKDPGRIAAILEGLRLAGLPEDARDAPTIPNLAVLPFANLGDDPAQDWFGDGVVEDIITALSRFRSFAVITRNAAFAYKGRAVEVRQVAQELGVRYVLEGSVRRAGERLRIAAQLVDGSTGAHLWAENFDGSVADVFDFQDRITGSVVTLVEPHITAAEIVHSRRERAGSVAAYDIYLRALAKISTETVRDNSDAYALLTEALSLEPENALFLALASWAIEHRNTMGWPPFGPDDREKCAELARRGLELAAGDAMVMAHCGMSLLQGAREYDWGMAVLQSAVEANPNNLMVVVRAGVGHLHCGDLDEALACFHRADRLSPGDPGAHFPLSGIANVHLMRGNFTEALDWAARALAINPNFDPILWVLIAANAHLGRMASAHRLLDQLRILAPGITIAKIRAAQPDRHPARMAALVEGLRLAGLEAG